MDVSQTSMSIEELAERVGVPTRTVRFYIAEGLLPGPGSRGKSATYSAEHLIRLRLIRRLAERHVPLAETRAALERLSLAEARALLTEEDARVATLEQAAQAASPRDYVAGLLELARAARSPTTRPATPAQPSPRSKPLRPFGLSAPVSPPSPPSQPASLPPSLSPPPISAPGASGAPIREAPGRYPETRDEAGEGWRRWDLAPGVELHAREDAARRFRALIERLLRAARMPEDEPRP